MVWRCSKGGCPVGLYHVATKKFRLPSCSSKSFDGTKPKRNTNPNFTRSTAERDLFWLVFLAILVAAGIVLQVLACALYDNWWPMLTGTWTTVWTDGLTSLDRYKGRAQQPLLSALMYVLLPMPLMFLAGSDTSSLFTTSENSWVNAAKFLTGASTVGSVAIPSILKHANVIGWGALLMDLSSLFIFVVATIFYLMSNANEYGML